MKKIVLTINLGNRPFHRYTLKSMERYSKKIGCKLLSITKWKNFTDSGNDIQNRFIKLEIIYYYLQKYDRLIYFDDTCYITPNTEDLFKKVPVSAVGAFIESKIFNRKTTMQKIVNYYSKFDDAPPFDNVQMVNSGVLVLSKLHAKLFNSKKYILKVIWCADQGFLSYKIHQNNIQIYDIKNINNYLGSQIQKNISNIMKKHNKNHIYHVTSGAKGKFTRVRLLKILKSRFEHYLPV